MNQPRSPQTTAAELSCLIHLLLALGGLVLARYAVNPETPTLVIDFTLAAVNSAQAATGQPGDEAPKPRVSPVPTPVKASEVRKEPPLKKPTPAPRKVVKPDKPMIKPKPSPSPVAPRSEVATPVPLDPTPAATAAAAPATSAMAQAATSEQGNGDRATEAAATPAAGGPGPGGQGAAGEGGGIPYSYEYVRRLITDNLRFPVIARRMGLSGRIVVAFTLKGDGKVADIAITSSSGHVILDEEVVATLHRIAPLPRPPATARLVVPIVFNLRR